MPVKTDVQLTPEEVAKRLKVCTKTVLRMIHRQELAAVRVSPRFMRVTEAALANYLASRARSRVADKIVALLSRSAVPLDCGAIAHALGRDVDRYLYHVLQRLATIGEIQRASPRRYTI